MKVIEIDSIENIPWAKINALLLACGGEREPKRLIETFMREIAGIVPFDSARAFLTNGEGTVEGIVSLGIAEKWNKSYRSYFSFVRGGRYSMVEDGPSIADMGMKFAAAPDTADCFLYDWSQGFDDQGFQQDYLEPQGIVYVLGCNLFDAHERHWCTVMFERGRLGAFDRRDLATFALLAAHLGNMVKGLFTIPRKEWAPIEGIKLTPREREVALLILRGLTAPAIEKRLVISRRTVYRHIAGLHKKLDVHTYAELMLALEAIEDELR